MKRSVYSCSKTLLQDGSSSILQARERIGGSSPIEPPRTNQPGTHPVLKRRSAMAAIGSLRKETAREYLCHSVQSQPAESHDTEVLSQVRKVYDFSFRPWHHL